MFRVEKQRSLKANTSEPKVGAETETEEQLKLKNDKYGTCYTVHSMHKHEEETRAHLMTVKSEVRLDQATWSSNARTLRVVMKETSEMRLWR